MSDAIRAHDAPAQVAFDSADRAALKGHILKLAKQARARYGPCKELVVEFRPDDPADTEGALLHSIFEEIRREDPNYTLRYGGTDPDGKSTVALVRTCDVAVKSIEREMSLLFSGGLMIRGAE